MKTSDNTQDILDSRDVIERLEELQSEQETLQDELDAAIESVKFHHDGELDESGEFPEHEEYRRCRDELQQWDEENAEELKALQDFVNEESSGWRHGVTLVSESYFEEYARELAKDIGAIDPRANWPLNCIDWEQAAQELKQDYTGADFAGVTYYFNG